MGGGTLVERYAAGERDFSDVDLIDVELEGVELSAICLARSSLCQAFLSRAVLVRADLSETNLMGANLESAVLSHAGLGEANLMGAVLRDAVLDGADVTRANLVYVDARRADLRGADLCGADLAGADLGHADLSGAALAGANLTGARLEGAVLEGTDLDGADLTDVRLDSDEDLLGCAWQTLAFSGTVYERSQVERGLQTLPVGKGNPLTFVFEARRELTGTDLLAVRCLVRVFDRLARGASLSFQMGFGGETLVLGCGGTSDKGYRDAFELGLRLMQEATRPSRKTSKTRMTRELAESLRSLSSAPPPPPAELSEELARLLSGAEEGADDIARMLTAFQPIRLQLHNAADVRSFQEAAANRDVVLDDLVAGEYGWTLLPRIVAHYLGLPPNSELLPEGLLSHSEPPASTGRMVS